MKSPSLADGTEGATQAPPGPNPSRLDRCIDFIAWLAAAAGAGVVLLMMSVVGYGVVNRYILGSPITWTDELSGYLVVALVMLGAAETLRRGEHISVDLLTANLTPKRRRIADLWGNLMVLVVSVSLLISGKATILYSWDFGILSEGYLEVPMWIPQSFIILGAALLALVAVTNMLKLMRQEIAP